jgi:cell division protein ZapA
METISVNIPLGNRQYKIKIAPENEARVRNAIEHIQQTSKSLRQQFPGRDEQDYLAMTLIDFVNKTDASAEANNTELLNQLHTIDQLLGE